MTHVLHWFRTDLRIIDNSALQAAMQSATQLTTLFIFTPETWQSHGYSSSKMQYTLGCLNTLSTNLAKQNIPLLTREEATFMDSVATIMSICDEHGINQVYFNKQYELDEVRRDDAVIDALRSLSIKCHAYDDQTIIPPGEITNISGEPYKVFTPFKKACLKKLMGHLDNYRPAAPSKKMFQTKLVMTSSGVPTQVSGFNCKPTNNNSLAGEDNALEQLSIFAIKHLKNYHLQRDFPSISGTSRLSAALALGAISPRQFLEVVIQQTQGQLLNEVKFPGELTWLSELIWRNFYKHIIFHYPNLCRHKPFKPMTDNLPWNTDKKLVEAWQEGKTGFPLVDAAMRQLNQTGWMHNRLRMVTAMFFTKTLFLDWRIGEKYFMEHLIDGDFAANNGGWQWCASTGTDSVPYFRIFNPTTQSERFDKEGDFIRQYCPELASLTNKEIHDPSGKGVNVSMLGYPAPIVDYKAMRAYVIDQFKHNSEEGHA